VTKVKNKDYLLCRIVCGKNSPSHSRCKNKVSCDANIACLQSFHHKKVIIVSFSVSLLTPVVRGVMLCAGLVPHHVLFCYVGKVFGLPVYRFPYGTSWTFRGNRSLQYCQYRWELVPFRAFPFRALMKIFPIRSSS
jgi:hypothetical protein